MTYRIKITRMVDGRRVETWILEPYDYHADVRGSRYTRSAAIGVVYNLWSTERYRDTGLVAVELVEVE